MLEPVDLWWVDDWLPDPDEADADDGCGEPAGGGSLVRGCENVLHAQTCAVAEMGHYQLERGYGQLVILDREGRLLAQPLPVTEILALTA